MIRTATRRARYTLRKPTCTQCRSLSTSYYANGTLPSSTPPNKYPTRGGQNLTDRFRRLEKSIRGKGAYEQEIVELVGDRQENEPDGSRVRPAKRDVKTFMGFAIPEEPKPPGPDGKPGTDTLEDMGANRDSPCQSAVCPAAPYACRTSTQKLWTSTTKQPSLSGHLSHR